MSEREWPWDKMPDKRSDWDACLYEYDHLRADLKEALDRWSEATQWERDESRIREIREKHGIPGMSTQPDTKAGFTPGEWKIIRGPMGGLREVARSHECGSAATVYVEDRPGHVIAIAPNIYSAADARLIASAPELYEALEECLNILRATDGARKGHIGDHYVYTPQLDTERIDAAKTSARRALAKARGQ